MSVGGIELVILVVVLVMLFGPALFAFWLGYTMGKKRQAEGEPGPQAQTPTSPRSSAEGTDDDRGDL